MNALERGAAVIREQVRRMPGRPGVYRMLGAKGAVLYVGKAKNLRNRVANYTHSQTLPHRLQRMVAQVVGLEIVVTRTEAEALLLEASLIQRFLPPFNILLRDDKSYPFIVLTRDHPFPQITKHRGAKTRPGWYYGPFVSASAVAETLTLLQRGFLLRSCADSFFAHRTRPCLQYHIKRCSAPCVGKITAEAYAQQVDEARAFLAGRGTALQQALAADMQAASGAQAFERAAVLRDRIKALTAIQARQDLQAPPGAEESDIIAVHQEGGRTAVHLLAFRGGRPYGTRSFFPLNDEGATPEAILAAFLSHHYADQPAPPLVLLSHTPDEAAMLESALTPAEGPRTRLLVPARGAKKNLVEHAARNAAVALGRKVAEGTEQAKLLARFAETFGLPAPPNRIEVYDNSHLGGGHAVGGMIAAGPEGFLKKTYRLFTIHDAPGDDVGMMREVLTRRFRRLLAEDPERRAELWPDVLLMDGGQGQVNATVATLESLGVEDVRVIGIAKGPDRNAGREHFFMPGRAPFALPFEDPLLYYLQRLRDEAHRFAIGAHRAKRTRAIGHSGLEEIPGVGAVRKKALLLHFGSARAVSAAGIEDIARAPGLSPALAQVIYAHFHPETGR